MSKITVHCLLEDEAVWDRTAIFPKESSSKKLRLMSFCMCWL